MSFVNLNLNPSIAKALNNCGYSQPTPIQAASIPSILEGKDLIASAQTGTGKTAAFVLPALQRLSHKKSGPNPRVLILSPTRELATQITRAVDKYGKFLKINSVSLVGGMSYHSQIRGLSQPVDIVVATPGRLLDHMERQRVNLSNIEMLVIDEADRMLDMGFIDDVKLIAGKTPTNRQVLLFSATIDERLSRAINHLLKNPARIDFSNEKIIPTHIQHSLYVADTPQHKTQIFQRYLTDENIFKAIIFTATKIQADKMARQLRDQGLAAAALHGDLKQSVRNSTVEQLRRGKIQYLVATDVAARGIDIADITHVINYDLPKSAEDYVHRIGRTGRAGKSGIAISLALANDARQVQQIERYMGQRFVFATMPGLEPTRKLMLASPKQNPRRRNFAKDARPKSNDRPRTFKDRAKPNKQHKQRRKNRKSHESA